MEPDNSFETLDTYVSDCIDSKSTKSPEEEDDTRSVMQKIFTVRGQSENGESDSVESNSMSCNKRYVTFIWAILECIFFSGVILGWTWLTITLRRDMYFAALCNISLPLETEVDKFDLVNNQDILTNAELTGDHVIKATVKIRKCRRRTTTPTPEYGEYQTYYPPFNDTQYFCDDQEMRLSAFYAIIMTLRNALILPLGFFFDKYGTTRTRLVIVLPFVVGTLMMTFSSPSFPWLIIPAFSLLSIAGLVILITNLQISNLFGDRRYTVMAILIGAYHSSSVILFCMKETHDIGVGTQTSFMFLTIAVVPILVSTIAFLPKSRIPWPLPAMYGKRHRIGKDGRRKSIHTGNSNREDMAAFLNVAGSSLFIWSLVWYSVYSLRAFVYDGNLRYLLISYGAPKSEVIEYEKIFSLLHLVSLPISPFLGLLIDCQKLSSYYPPRIQQMHKILCLVLLTFLLALLNNILPIIPSLHIQMFGFVLQVIERVAVTICLCAFLTHVHFPLEHFGKYVSCHLSISSIICLLRFPSLHFVVHLLQENPFYINLLLLLLLLISCGHPINVWYHCRLGLIHDASASEYEGIEITDRLMHSGNEPCPTTGLNVA